MDDKLRKQLLTAQENEITEHLIYKKLSDSTGDIANRDLLKRISDDELRHYNFWREQTEADVLPDKLKVWKYFVLSKLLGVTFGVKLMENGEKGAQANYREISKLIAQAKSIEEDEERHEKQLIGMIDEERLKYVSSIVLGLNDALVEFTGALAGFTFALQSTRLVAVTGFIMGFAASLSMAASEYLSTKLESGGKNPVKASIYTGVVYMITVFMLVLPYLLLSNALLSLGVTILIAIIVIFMFTFYTSVAQDLNFKHRFMEMTAISLGVASLTFAIGYVVKEVFGIQI